MMEYWLLIVSAVFVSNIVLMRYLGNCPFMGVSTRMDTATGMSMAVVFVMVLATAITYVVSNYVLVPFELEYLQTIAFILVIASLVQFVEMFLQKFIPALYRSLGIFLPLITTNCAVLGVTVLASEQEDWSFVKILIFALASGIGFGLALILLTGIRERLYVAPVPAHLRGMPVGLISAGVLALAFLGFVGMV
jgi:electron transport complex protein RnfA